LTSLRSRLPTAPLFVQLLTFMVLSLAAAQAISLVLLFNLPPPTPDFYRLTEVAQAFRGTPPTFTDRRPLELRVSDEPPSPATDKGFARKTRAKLSELLGVPEDRMVIAARGGPFADRRVFRILRDRAAQEGVREEHFLLDPFEIGIQRDDGKWVSVRPKAAFGLTPWQTRIAIWFLLSGVALAPIAYLFARRLSAPIRGMARAAERLGRDPNAPPVDLRGSAEVAVAAAAFNDMQARLARYVEDRTAMMASIAHDLRTPLTRLRFRIESAPEEQRAKMAADLDQMEEMVSATLAFVRDATRPGERTPLELSSLVESVCDEMAETGACCEVRSADKVVLEGDPMALRRLFANLLENALKFGGQARARVYHDGVQAVVEVEDDGPGIPEGELERVFEPFYRREPSRSRKTGGIGLGLAVVRTIARGHGGDVALANRPGGGLTARVQLPL